MNIEAKIKENISLGKYTTFRIGGKAKYFIEIKSKEELQDVLEWSRKNDKEMFIMGGGSNLLVNDAGVNGIVVKFSNKDITFRGNRVECEAGANLIATATKSLGQGLTGLEWATGIPGSVGGAVRGNAGAFGSSIKDLVETIEVYNLKLKKFDVYSKNISKFSYRDSIFKQNKNLLIWSVTFKLLNGDRDETDKMIEKYALYRQKTQPKFPSAGSIFKNIGFNQLCEANQDLADLSIKEMVTDGAKDVGAGWIIDKLKLQGKKIGDAKISLEHANFIVNTCNASSSDVAMLISYIKQQVRDRFKVQLMEEIEYFGF